MVETRGSHKFRKFVAGAAAVVGSAVAVDGAVNLALHDRKPVPQTATIINDLTQKNVFYGDPFSDAVRFDSTLSESAEDLDRKGLDLEAKLLEDLRQTALTQPYVLDTQGFQLYVNGYVGAVVDSIHLQGEKATKRRSRNILEDVIEMSGGGAAGLAGGVLYWKRPRALLQMIDGQPKNRAERRKRERAKARR